MSNLSNKSQPSQHNMPAHDFTPEEFTRLAAYKAAIQAGIYNELLDPKHAFTQDEVTRLAAYKGAIHAGVYSDWRLAHEERRKRLQTELSI